MPKGAYTVEFGEDSRPWQPPPLPEDDAEFAKPDVQTQGREQIERLLAAEPAAFGQEASA